MNDIDSREFVAYVSARLDVALTDEERDHAAERAVLKRAELAPLYALGAEAPLDGVQTFIPR